MCLFAFYKPLAKGLFIYFVSLKNEIIFYNQVSIVH